MSGRFLRTRFLIREVDERRGARDLELMSVSMTRGVIPRSSLTEDEPRADDLSNYKVCRPGDIVVNRMSAYQGALGMAEQAGIVSPDYIVFRPEGNVSPRWLHHVMRSTWFVAEMASRIRGIGSIGTGNVRTPRVSAEEIGEIRVQVPDEHYQREIADYLDAETARIDALIAKKQRMAELLDERFGIALCSLFTNLRAPLRRVTSIAHVSLGRQRNPASDSGPNMVPYLRAANVKDGWLDLDDVKEMNFTPKEQQTFALKRGDILVTEGAGSLTAVGASAPWLGELSGTVCFQNTLIRLRPRDPASANYLAWWTRFAYRSGQFADLAGGANIFHIGAERLQTLLCPVPDLERQQQVADEADQLARIHSLAGSAIEHQVSLLREHRQVLITAAVTGELEVPGVEA